MKKMLVAAIAALGIISATVSFADALNGAAGKKFSVMSTTTEREQTKAYLNEVFVLNASGNQIRVQSASGIDLSATPNAFVNLFSNGCIPVAIFNSYNGTLLMNQTVCGRNLVVVRGSYNGVYIDEFDKLPNIKSK